VFPLTQSVICLTKSHENSVSTIVNVVDPETSTFLSIVGVDEGVGVGVGVTVSTITMTASTVLQGFKGVVGEGVGVNVIVGVGVGVGVETSQSNNASKLIVKQLSGVGVGVGVTQTPELKFSISGQFEKHGVLPYKTHDPPKSLLKHQDTLL
jgi:hypothetical protein